MIKVNVEYQNDKLFKVTIKGHANYDDYGKDIVCSAVSSIATTTLNNILTLDKDACIYDTNDGLLVMSVINENEIAIKLFNNMLNMLKQLEEQYKQNIKIGGLK